jgi:septum formation protein
MNAAGASPVALILASRSPRRAALLRQLGLRFEVEPADVAETRHDGEAPGAFVERLAREKAQVVGARHPDALVIGSDTTVVVDGNVLEKPRDATDAVDMLLRLQGREHTVATGVAVAYDAGQVVSGVEHVRVRFRAFDRTIAQAYVDTGEPMDKAGAYGIQGYGAALVDGITGDYFAVMGLPIVLLLNLLRELGWTYTFGALTRA